MTTILETAPRTDKTALSPFIEGTNIQFAWDSTSLGWLKECPRKYQYSMIQRWRSRHNSVHLDFGLFYHDALESYDKFRANGASHVEALRETVLKCLTLTWITDEEGGRPWESDHVKSRETLVRSVIWYLEEFGENDAATTVILANGKPAVELSFRLEMDFAPESLGDSATLTHPYIISGHLDRVVSFQDNFFVMDRKTASGAITGHYFDGYSPDNQMSLYSFASKVIYQTPVKGVIIDAAQIMVGFTRFGRGFTFRTESQLEEWLDDTKVWLAIAEQYAIAGHWPMNDKSCGNYGGCVFRKVCSKSPEVREKFLETDFHRVEWNPLKPR